jgi:hypothetical protein
MDREVFQKLGVATQLPFDEIVEFLKSCPISADELLRWYLGTGILPSMHEASQIYLLGADYAVNTHQRSVKGIADYQMHKTLLEIGEMPIGYPRG